MFWIVVLVLVALAAAGAAAYDRRSRRRGHVSRGANAMLHDAREMDRDSRVVKGGAGAKTSGWTQWQRRQRS